MWYNSESVWERVSCTSRLPRPFPNLEGSALVAISCSGYVCWLFLLTTPGTPALSETSATLLFEQPACDLARLSSRSALATLELSLTYYHTCSWIGNWRTNLQALLNFMYIMSRLCRQICTNAATLAAKVCILPRALWVLLFLSFQTRARASDREWERPGPACLITFAYTTSAPTPNSSWFCLIDLSDRMRIVTWNVDGLRAMLGRRQESLASVLEKLDAGPASL